MVLLGSTFILVLAVTAECQVVFPSSGPQPSNKKNVLNDCIAGNGQEGTCYEYRSAKFKECSYFPSLDLGNPDVANHLRKNICRHTGRAVYFCCPLNAPKQQHPPIPVDSDFPSMFPPPGIPSEEDCGKSDSFNVVGGNLTNAGDWPWLAAIGRKVDGGFIPFCGGTLITKQHVISAAHCFKRRFHKTTVRLGEYNVNDNEDGAIDFDIVDQRVGNYDENTKENDIILLKMDRPLKSFTNSIKPACLPYHLRNDNFEGKKLIVVGWGIFDNNDKRISPVPIQGQVPVVPVQECQQKYKSSGNVIDERQICAGKGGTDSCGGDSGGPINYLDLSPSRQRFYVVGLVSFGPRFCGSNNLPGVYTRIGNYLEWLEDSYKELM